MPGLEEEAFFISGHEFIGVNKEGKHSPTCKLCAELEKVAASIVHDPATCDICHGEIPGHNPETCDLCRN